MKKPVILRAEEKGFIGSVMIWVDEEEEKPVEKQYINLEDVSNILLDADEGDVIEMKARDLSLSGDILSCTDLEVLEVIKESKQPNTIAEVLELAENYNMILQKAAPGPPPRPGLAWKEQTHRWIRPREAEDGYDVAKVKVGFSTEVEKQTFRDKIMSTTNKLKGELSGEAEHRWTNYAEGLSMSVVDLKKAVAAKLQKLVDEADIWIRVPTKSISKILREGRFKSISETKKMSPGKAMNKLQTYLQARGEVENHLFGFTDEATFERPIYGYMAAHRDGRMKEFERNKETGVREDWLSEYGDVRVKLKSSVRDRSTFTLHDSLDINYYAGAGKVRIVPSLLSKIEGEVALGDLVDPRRNYKDISDAENMYSEVQIHHGLGLSDIEELVFEKLPDDKFLERLDKAGIKYREMKRRKGEIL